MPRGTVLEAAIDSDVLLPRAVIEADQPKPAEPHHGPASVTFYYPNFEDGAAVNVWCGEVKVAHLKRGGKFTLSLPPRQILAPDLEFEEESYYRIGRGRWRRGIRQSDHAYRKNWVWW